MIVTPRINEAIKLASRLHREQVRNDDAKTPYVSHLMAVAMILSHVTDDEDVIIAGLLHDSLEDVPGYTYDQLVLDCGERVAAIVKHVTEPLDANKDASEQLPWLARKEAYLEVLRTGDAASAMVSSADKIHNTDSFLQDIEKEGDAFAKRFGSSILNRVWFHEQVLAIVSEKLGESHPLVVMFSFSTEKFRALATRTH